MRTVSGGSLSPDSGEKLNTIHVGHAQIGYHHRKWASILDHLDALFPAKRSVYPGLLAQLAFEARDNVGIIVYQEDLFGSGRLRVGLPDWQSSFHAGGRSARPSSIK